MRHINESKTLMIRKKYGFCAALKLKMRTKNDLNCARNKSMNF